MQDVRSVLVAMSPFTRTDIIHNCCSSNYRLYLKIKHLYNGSQGRQFGAFIVSVLCESRWVFFSRLFCSTGTECYPGNPCNS